MKRTTFISMLLCLIATGGFAQRVTDKLDRGLVAMKTTDGVFLSWRITAEEYYDTEYNVYRDGTKLNTNPLSISNFTDKEGTATANYTVRAVVGGKEQEASAAVTPWSSGYKEINLTHPGIKSRFCPNDATCADVDGDGELEILMKYDNIDEVEQAYPKYGPTVGGVVTGEYTIFECLKQDGTRLWWVNCGPNLADFQNNEQNIMAYDWDGDGRAEAVMRAADGTVVHMADGTTYEVGNMAANIRDTNGGGVNWFICAGFGESKEYLLYLDGLTGKPYQCIPYPLPFLEPGETDPAAAWGNKNWAHRCSKHFVGAPYLDGHKPSIFLARGIYTRHKMIALDVDPTTHELVQRWKWYCNADGPWKGQGYHNYGVADVDMDGRDEIVFGSMVIDDNGRGLSTTGLGHGDAQHCSDFDPYRHGLEIYACLENSPVWGNNYRDATISKVYHHHTGGRDDGRCMAGNFTNSYPGAIGFSNTEGVISTVTSEGISGVNSTGVHNSMRIYWDGDLCEESYAGNGISKLGAWDAIYTCQGGLTNNGSKNTPCFQGDILGDWREEIIMRTEANNIRIYSTPSETEWRNYTLWHDHQYRNAMVWQMCGYNQPPHASYFLGEMEGITVAPPPLTNTGRINVSDGMIIGTDLNDRHVLVAENADISVELAAGVEPSVLTFNVPTWVQGTAPSECTTKETKINRTTYICTVTGHGIGGKARLVKQGDGTLVLPKTDFNHMGETNVWGGTLHFDGTMLQSPLWLNRHTRLHSDGGEFLSIKADYGATIKVGDDDDSAASSIAADTLSLGFGSRLVIDLYAGDLSADEVNVGTLKIEHKTDAAWVKAGPEYLMPVVEFVGHLADGQPRMTPGKYVIGNVGNIEGAIDDLIVEGIATAKKKLYVEDGKLILEVFDLRAPSIVTWSGIHSGVWDISETENFSLADSPTGFVAGDSVVFDDNAQQKTVTISQDVLPAFITVTGTEDYVFNGEGAIAGSAVFIKEGVGTVTMQGSNSYVGGNHLKGGTTKVALLANQYSDVGNLGGITTNAELFTMENGAVLQTTAAVETGSPIKMLGDEGGVINCSNDFRMNASLTGTTLTKKGNGVLFTMGTNALSRLVIAGGSVAAQNGNPATTVELHRGTLYDDAQATSHGIHVPEGKSGIWQLTYAYYTAYSNKITGNGTLTIVPRNGVQRVRIIGDWSEFEGTIRHTTQNVCLPLDGSAGMPKGTLYLADGCAVSNVAKSFAIGKLTGKGQLLQPVANFVNSAAVSGSNTWNVGNSFETDGDFTFDGIFTDGGGSNKCIFNKVGTCTMTVTGQSTHSGATTVKEGTLHLSSGATLGTGELTVAKGAAFLGVTSSDVTLTNSKTTVNGTLQVGAKTNSFFGLLDFGGEVVTFNKGAVYRLVARKCASANKSALGNGCAMIDNVGVLHLNGTISVQLASSHTLQAGDSIRIFSARTVLGRPTFDLPAIEGLEWDTTKWKEGYLHLRAATRIVMSIAPDEQVRVAAYTVHGQHVATFSCKRSDVETKATNHPAMMPGIYIFDISSDKGRELLKWMKP